MQLFSWQLFHLKSSMHRKSTFEFLTFEIQIFQTTLDGERTKKVVDLKKVMKLCS
jgi:hypothetical protein